MKLLFAMVPLLVALPRTALFGQRDHEGHASKVNAFEVRPDVIMIPRTSSGGFCEMTLQKNRYSQGKANLDSDMPPALLLDILNEIAPDEKRGRSLIRKPLDKLEQLSGQSRVHVQDFENLSITTYRRMCAGCERGPVLVLIRWKHRSCRDLGYTE